MNVPGKPNNFTLKRCLICYNSNKISSSDIYYFRLPSDDVVAAEWMRNLNRNELVKHISQQNLSDSVWICSEHFPKSAIYRNPNDNTTATLLAGTLPLIVKSGTKKSQVILTAAERNVLFCRQKPHEVELTYFRQQFKVYQNFQNYRVHCTTCDAHLILAPANKDQIEVHSFLKVIQCDKCFNFDGKRGPLPVNKDLTIQCQCGVANTLVKCYCTTMFCKECYWKDDAKNNKMALKCLWCTPTVTLDLRALQWAVFKVLDFKYKSIKTNEKYKNFSAERIQKLLQKDLAGCCGNGPVFGFPNKSPVNLEKSVGTVLNNKNPQIINTVNQTSSNSTEIKTYNAHPIKKHILTGSDGKPVVMDKQLPHTKTNCIPSTSELPPLALIPNAALVHRVPIISNVASISGEAFTPILKPPNIETTFIAPIKKMRGPRKSVPNVKLLKPVRSYSKMSKTPQSGIGSSSTALSQSKKCRTRPELDDRCLEIKTNFKNNGVFLKTLCDHFIFKVESMKQMYSPERINVNLHAQLVSAIEDVCDKLESVKDKCTYDIQKCDETKIFLPPQTITTPMIIPTSITPTTKEDDDCMTDVSNIVRLVEDQEMVASIPVTVPNGEEDEEEEVFELYDIVDTECDVSILDSDTEEIDMAEV